MRITWLHGRSGDASWRARPESSSSSRHGDTRHCRGRVMVMPETGRGLPYLSKSLDLTLSTCILVLGVKESSIFTYLPGLRVSWSQVRECGRTHSQNQATHCWCEHTYSKLSYFCNIYRGETDALTWPVSWYPELDQASTMHDAG